MCWYKLYFRESNAEVDKFVSDTFKLEFPKISTDWSAKSMENILLDEQQAIILRLTYPFVRLFKEHERYTFD